MARAASKERGPFSSLNIEQMVHMQAPSVTMHIDLTGAGSISKLELYAAMQRSRQVSEFLLPGVDSNHLMDDEESFEKADAMFDAIAGKNNRISKAPLLTPPSATTNR